MIILAGLVSGCAQVAELSGGPKDEAAPVLVRSVPPQNATNFTGQRIVLEFDERIQLDRVRDRLLVSPPLEKAPDVRLLNARSVAIDLAMPLMQDRTYTFSIGEAIKDLTEGNQALGLALVFSTGAELDSLSITGVVRDAYTGLPRKDMLVMAYPIDSVAAFTQGRPAYATRSAADGSYTLMHLRAADYLVRALHDLNANYRYDLPSEALAFHHEAIPATMLDSSQRAVDLYMFQEEAAEQRIIDQRVKADGQWTIVLAQEARELNVQDVSRRGGTLRWDMFWNARRDSVELWPSDTTMLRAGSYRITVDGNILDTLSYRPLLRMPFYTSLALVGTEEHPGITLRASRPVRSTDSTRFFLRIDTLERSVRADIDASDPRLIHLGIALPEASQAVLTVLPKGVRDLFGGSNDTVRIALQRSGAKDLGTVRIRMAADSSVEGMRILQLLDGSEKVIREARVDGASREVAWERIPPGSFSLRVIADLNANGRWDPGMLQEGKQPERVYTYDKPIQVRASWDLRVDVPPFPKMAGRP
ncbi:MAG: Ig-like domain-containing protein [Flavobacteriales bacterium]